jgi:flagellar operon protein
MQSMSREFVDGLVSRSYLPVRPRSADRSTEIQRTNQTNQSEFREVLNQVAKQCSESGTGNLKISAHAKERMKQRGFELKEQDLAQLSQAVDKAQKKGSRDAYLLYGDAGYIVNVPNRTVITAVTNADDTIVTNIDSVVIVPRPDLD